MTTETTTTDKTSATSTQLMFQLAKTAIPALGGMGLKGTRLLVVAVVAFLAYLGATGQPLAEFIGSYSDYLNETLAILFAVVAVDKESGVRGNAVTILDTIANAIRPADTAAEDVTDTTVEAVSGVEDATVSDGTMTEAQS